MESLLVQHSSTPGMLVGFTVFVISSMFSSPGSGRYILGVKLIE